jgi:thiol-disulfide isomerase/thioredoxin
MAGLVALLGVLVMASAVGIWMRRSGRRLGRSSAASLATGERLTAEDLGAPLGERATLVQFSTAFCQPCRATRRLLAQISDQVEGVRHVDVDAESELGLVRRLDIRRTPTVLVLDRAGRIVRRASGQPRKPDVVAALGHAIQL